MKIVNRNKQNFSWLMLCYLSSSVCTLQMNQGDSQTLANIVTASHDKLHLCARRHMIPGWGHNPNKTQSTRSIHMRKEFSLTLWISVSVCVSLSSAQLVSARQN